MFEQDEETILDIRYYAPVPVDYQVTGTVYALSLFLVCVGAMRS